MKTLHNLSIVIFILLILQIKNEDKNDKLIRRKACSICIYKIRMENKLKAPTNPYLIKPELKQLLLDAKNEAKNIYKCMNALSTEKVEEYSNIVSIRDVAFDCSPDFTEDNYTRLNPSQKEIMLNQDEREIYTYVLEREYYDLATFLYTVFHESKGAKTFLDNSWKKLQKRFLPNTQNTEYEEKDYLSTDF